MKKNEKKMKKTRKIAMIKNDKKMQFSSLIFFHFKTFFFYLIIIFLSFSKIFQNKWSIPKMMNAKMINQNDKKNDKKMKTTRGKLQFFIFRKIFAPLEAKMMKNDKKMKKMKKKWKKMKKNEKKMKHKMIKKW